MQPDPPQGFACFILTNGRPHKVQTYEALRRRGYTGPIYLVVDDLDETRPEYTKKYGEQVLVFDKKATAASFDTGDNFEDMRAIVYARNASFTLAKELGLTHFMQLDDDYSQFEHRFTPSLRHRSPGPRSIQSLDNVLRAMVTFLDASGAHAIAMAQGGDYIGGITSRMGSKVRLARKAMNSFLCSTSRPFQFVGRVNEDVNTYTREASTGLLMLTTSQVSLVQEATQTSSGGMTEMYLDSGTYLKSMYTVMYQPSSVLIRPMRTLHTRLHHEVSWRHTVPKILPEALRKVAA